MRFHRLNMLAVGLLVAAGAQACASDDSEVGETGDQNLTAGPMTSGAVIADAIAKVTGTFKASNEYVAFATKHARCTPKVNALYIDNTHTSRSGRWIFLVSATPGEGCPLDDSLTSLVKLDWESGGADRVAVMPSQLDSVVRTAAAAGEMTETQVFGGTGNSEDVALAKAIGSRAGLAFRRKHGVCVPGFQATQIHETPGDRGGQKTYVAVGTPGRDCMRDDSIAMIVRVELGADGAETAGVVPSDIDRTIRDVVPK